MLKLEVNMTYLLKKINRIITINRWKNKDKGLTSIDIVFIIGGIIIAGLVAYILISILIGIIIWGLIKIVLPLVVIYILYILVKMAWKNR